MKSTPKQPRKTVKKVPALPDTATQNTDKSLCPNNDMFRTLFENSSSPTAIFEVDTTISIANAAFCNLVGYPMEELTGMSWTTLISPEDLDRMKEHFFRGLENPENSPHEYEFSFSGAVANGGI